MGIKFINKNTRMLWDVGEKRFPNLDVGLLPSYLRVFEWLGRHSSSNDPDICCQTPRYAAVYRAANLELTPCILPKTI